MGELATWPRRRSAHRLRCSIASFVSRRHLGRCDRAFDGAILFLEDYNTPTINVWNDLQVLRLAGAFERIAGLIIGPVDGISILEGTTQTLREVVHDVVGDRDIPILANVNCGHAGPNVPLPLGVRAAIDADAPTIALVEAAVE